ncbi:MAG: hypothetical protein QW555_00415 [Nitrososphaerota archaeon]
MKVRLINMALLGATMLTPLIISADYMARIVLTPFLMLGLLSLLSTYLPPRYQFAVIPLIYAPAITSLAILVLDKQPEYLIDLASGYLVSLPFIAAVGILRSQNLRALLSTYIASLTSSYFLWAIAVQAGASKERLFLVMINLFLNRQGWGEISPPQYFAGLAAFSSIAMVTYAWREYGSALRHDLGEAFIVTATLASLAVALVVAYSLFFSDSVALGLLITGAISFYTLLRAGVLEKWRG